jgi:nucleoid-associated protein YgaU
LKARLGATEEQLASALRTYTELQAEVQRLRTDVDRTRAENVALGEQVKTVTTQNEQVQAALAQLNTDLLAQKDARFRAEQDAETLRTELKAVSPDASILARQRTGAAAEARSLVAEHAAETAALKEQLETLRTQVANLTTERTSLQQQLGTAASPQAAQAETKLEDALKTAQTLGEQLRSTQAQATALTEENAKLKARLARNPEVVEPAGANTIVIGSPTSNSVNSGSVTLTPKGSGVNATLVTQVGGGQHPATSADPAGANGTERFHVVGGGDTLAKISTQYYGTPGRWGDILAANREVLGENNNLVVGRTLRIP